MQYVDVSANSSGAQPLFVSNPAYLDRTKDDHAQIVLIDLTAASSSYSCGNATGVDSEVLLRQLEMSWIPLLPNLESIVNQ